MRQLTCSIVAITFTLLPFLLKFILKLRHKRKKLNHKNNYYQCIFINMNNFDCRPHLYEHQLCGEGCSYEYQNTILSFISSAQRSISLCIYMFSLKYVLKLLLKAHRRGVKVRVITDRVMLKTKVMKENFKMLTEVGVPFKHQPSEDDGMMHHKFCLIDKEDENLAKMFFGSLNLTTQGLHRNFEFVVFTNDKNIIARYSEEFEDLWTDFS